MSTEPRIVDPAAAETHTTPLDEHFVVLARGDEPGEDHDLILLTVPPEPGAVPLHVHHEADEGFYILEGEFLFQIGEDQHRLMPGMYGFGARGIPHAYRNLGTGPARMLVLFTPGTFVRMTEELEALGPLDPDDDSDLERVVPILESYGVEMVGPPPNGE